MKKNGKPTFVQIQENWEVNKEDLKGLFKWIKRFFGPLFGRGGTHISTEKNHETSAPKVSTQINPKIKSPKKGWDN
jgi:hypothetical protein